MESEIALSALLTRRSVSPRRLTHPAPSREELTSIIGAALRAPDHGGLLPWRVIEFPGGTRPSLAALFEAERLRRDPDASSEEVERAREHATHAPTILAFVLRPQLHPNVPMVEQWLGAGAALGNILSAAHLLGFGAIMLSGSRCRDAGLRAALGLGVEELLAGFVSIGTIGKASSTVVRPSRERVWSRWAPQEAAAACDL